MQKEKYSTNIYLGIANKRLLLILEKLHKLSVDRFWTVENFEKILSSINTYSIIIKGNKLKPIGFSVFRFFNNEMEIINFAITKDCQKKGVGNILLEEIFQLAINKNINKIFLEVSCSNIGALKLYQRNNFCEIGIRKGYYVCENNERVDAKRLVKIISND